MTTKIPFQAPGYHTITPLLAIKGAKEAIDFYKRAFNATELFRMASPDGTVMHAELKIGDSNIMLGDECPEMGALSPKTVGGSPTTLYIYFEDVDAMTKQAIAAGAKELQPVMDQFWGDRSGKIEDPFGHRWGLATHIEDVSPEEMDRRAKAWMSDKKK